MAVRKKIDSLKTGYRYYIQARYNDDVQTSDWSTVYEFDIDKDVTPPDPPTSLSVNFDESTFIATWDDTNARDSEDFLDFQVIITANSISLTYYIASTTFELPFEANRELFGTAQPSINIEVRSRDRSNNLSSSVSATGTNPVPSAPTGSFLVDGVIQGYSIDLSGLTGKPLDYLSARVFIHTASTGGTLVTAFDTTEDALVWSTANYLNRYVSIAYVDIFGRAGVATSRQSVRALNPIAIDTTQPIVGSGALLAGRSVSVSSYSISSNVITFTCSSAHEFSTGDDIVITGISFSDDGTEIDGLYENITVTGSTTFSASKTASNASEANIPNATATRNNGKRTLITEDGISGYINDSDLSFQLTNLSSGINTIGGWEFDQTSIRNTLPLDNNRNISINSEYVSLLTTVGTAPNITSSGITGACTTNCPVIWAGATSTDSDPGTIFSDRVNAPFLVRNDGSLESTKGIIGGWTIDSSELYSEVDEVSFTGTLSGSIWGAVYPGSERASFPWYSGLTLTITSASPPVLLPGQIIQSGTNTSRVVGPAGTNAYYIVGSITSGTSFTRLASYSGLKIENYEKTLFVNADDSTGNNSGVDITGYGLKFGDNKLIGSTGLAYFEVSENLGIRTPSAEYIFNDTELIIYNSTNNQEISTLSSKRLSLKNTALAGSPGASIADGILTLTTGSDTMTVNSTLISNGTSWVTPTMGSGWTGVASGRELKYKKMPDGNVMIRGDIKKNDTTNNSLVITLPSGYRPVATMSFPAVSGNGVARVDIYDNGELRISGLVSSLITTNVTLNGIIFPTF